MVALGGIGAQAMLLSESERAMVASHLLESLPSGLENDEGMAEALRRDAEMGRDPAAGMTPKETPKAFGRRSSHAIEQDGRSLLP